MFGDSGRRVISWHNHPEKNSQRLGDQKCAKEKHKKLQKNAYVPPKFSLCKKCNFWRFWFMQNANYANLAKLFYFFIKQNNASPAPPPLSDLTTLLRMSSSSYQSIHGSLLFMLSKPTSGLGGWLSCPPRRYAWASHPHHQAKGPWPSSR